MRLYRKLLEDTNWYFIVIIMLMSNSSILFFPFGNIWAMIISHSVISIFMIIAYYYILCEVNLFNGPVWWIFGHVFDLECKIEQLQRDQIEVWCENNCKHSWKYWKNEYILFWNHNDALAFKLFWK